MIITVLLAADGGVVQSALGMHSLYTFLESVRLSGGWYAEAIDHLDDLGGARFLRPGYRLEHHDLAELLARPTAEELQAAKEADHASMLGAFRLATAIQTAKVARLGAELQAAMERPTTEEVENWCAAAWYDGVSYHPEEPGGWEQSRAYVNLFGPGLDKCAGKCDYQPIGDPAKHGPTKCTHCGDTVPF